MKKWKLISGILSIVFFVIISLQSCTVGIGNSLSQNGEVSGTTGIIVALLILPGGIISIITRKASNSSSTVAMIILYGLAALLGFTMAENYKDLNIWAFWCLLCTALSLIELIKEKQKKSK